SQNHHCLHLFLDWAPLLTNIFVHPGRKNPTSLDQGIPRGNRMYKSITLSLLAMLCAANALPAQDEARLLRFPATHGDQIVFTYAGDLYSVPANGGTARKLTSHVGFEMFARFSPDGKWIAFTGQYDGNTE